jgi:hypothetical protein
LKRKHGDEREIIIFLITNENVLFFDICQLSEFLCEVRVGEQIGANDF